MESGLRGTEHGGETMGTTVTTDDDVPVKARPVAEQMHAPLCRVVDDALRAGSPAIAVPGETRPYRTQPQAMGLRPGMNLDNIQELLAQIE